MSHAPERKEKNCLNCGTIVVGRYCHVCGQENIEPRETVWHLVTHFFNDITHFDGKFFQTLKVLLLKPGFLSKEYIRGRRASYLNPVRMYVFTSAIFFLLFFSFLQRTDELKINGKTRTQVSHMDSAEFAAYTANLSPNGKPMSQAEYARAMDTGFIHLPYKTREEYDSLRRSGKAPDGWLPRQFIYRALAVNEKYGGNFELFISAFIHSLLHSMPQMLFVSLPLLALILRLLYVRRRRQFYYVSHGIFAIHLYIFVFIAMLIVFTLFRLHDKLHWDILTTLGSAIAIGIAVYEYLAMKNFYQQGWIKTFFKFFLMNVLYSIVLGLLFVIFLLLSFFNI